MELKNQSIKGFVWGAIEKLGNRFITFLIFFILAKLLSPEVFGIVAIVNSILAFVIIFVDQGFTTAVIQKEKVDQTFLDTAFWGNIGISILFTLILFLTAPLIAGLYEEPALTLYIRVISVSFIIGAMSRVQNALFIKEMKFRLLAIRRLLGTVVGGTIGIYLAVMDFGVWSLIFYQLSTLVTLTIVLSFQSDWWPKFNFSWKSYQELLKFGINVLGNNLLFYSQLHLVNLLIGFFLGTTALGYYSIANKVFVTFKDVVINTFSRIILPLFAKIQHKEEFRTLVFQDMVSKIVYLILPFSVGLIFLFSDIVFLFLGDAWTPSIPLIQILFLACAFTVIPSFSNDFLLGVGKPETSFRLNLVNAVIYLIGVIVGTQFGVTGTALGVAAGLLIAVPVTLFFLRNVMVIQWNKLIWIHIRALGSSVLLAGVLIGFNAFFSDVSYLMLGIKSVVTVFVYIALLYLIYPDLFEEIRSIFQKTFGRNLPSVLKQ